MRKTKSVRKIRAVKSLSPRKSGDITANRMMLFNVRDELKHEITSTKLELRSDINKVQADVNRVQADVNRVQAAVEKVLAAVQRVELLVEDQNARNRYVLDGYTSLNDRIEKVEKKIVDENL